MKKNRGAELIGVIKHMYMEMSQGHSLCGYLKQAKMSFFPFFLLQNYRTGEWNRSCLGVEGDWYQ
jgi:hypothetical protein